MFAGKLFIEVAQVKEGVRCQRIGRRREIPTLDSLLAAYNDAWRQATEGPSPIQYGKKEDEHLLRGLATRMLLAYRRHSEGQTGEVIAIEHAARFKLVPDAPPLEARLDLVEVEGDALALTDLKTSRSAWNEQAIREHVPQLVLYAHSGDALRRGLGLKRVKPRFVVVTKARDPKIQVIESAVCQGDVDRLKETVAETWHAIKAGAFVRREGWHCQSCPFRKRCLGR